MSWIDNKYISLISVKLDRFKKVGSNYNFRCPFCGDSQKNKFKARGWILTDTGKSRYYCHNCGASMKLHSFIKSVDQSLYFEYIKENMMETNKLEPNPTHEFADCMKTPVFVKTTELNNLKKISQLDPNHPAKKYIDKRKIPTNKHFKLFYAPKFKSFVNKVLPGKFEDLEYDEPRLIIPFLDRDKKLFGFQGRSFNPKSNTKYITIMLDDDMPKIFGIEDIDYSKQIYMFEGPIDAMFVDNSLASAGGKIESNIDKLGIEKSNVVIVYDNEPRNAHTVAKLKSSISNGYRVCIWPDRFIWKDVNDSIIAGLSKNDVEKIIQSNIFHGLAAQLRLIEWSKI